MRWIFTACLLLLVGCGDGLPSATDLHGSWTTGDFANLTWDVTFAAQDDGTHGELDGLSDVYLWSVYPRGVDAGFVQTGTYRVEGAVITRVLRADDGPYPAGTELTNEITSWDGDRLVIVQSDFELVYRRE